MIRRRAAHLRKGNIIRTDIGVNILIDRVAQETTVFRGRPERVLRIEGRNLTQNMSFECLSPADRLWNVVQ